MAELLQSWNRQA